MRIVILTTSPISLRFVRGIVSRLKEEKVEIHVVASGGQYLEEFAAQFSVETHAIDMRRSISPYLDLRALWKLIQLFQKLRPEIVHAHTPKAGLLGMLASCLTRVPVRIYHLHGLPLLTAKAIRRRILLACDQVACAIASQVYCVSESLRTVVEQLRICRSRKLAVIEKGSIDGVDAAVRFHPRRFSAQEKKQLKCDLGIPPDAKVIGFVGRLVPDKGLEELIGAWKQLRGEFDEVRLLLVGSYEPQNPLSHRVISNIRSDPRVHHVEFVDEPEQYFSIIDILAFPSYREGFGLVAIEAAAFAIPVVATRIPGCVDAVLDGITGTLVPPQDAPALANALQRYLKEPELVAQHGFSGRQRVLKDFVSATIRETQWQEYRRLLTEAGLAECASCQTQPYQKLAG
jgi:glycosyltransferase involved in cell wall biosynthesis